MIPTCFVMISLAAVAGCSSQAARARETAKAQLAQVKTVVVAEEEWPSFHEAVGTVRARTTAQVSSRMMAYVREALVTVGDQVRRGQRLVVLDAPDLESRQRQSAAARNEARTAAIEAASSVESAKASLDLAEVTFRRIQDLYEKRSVSNQEFDEASARRRVAEANFQMTVSRRKQIDSKIAQAEEEMKAAQIQAGYSVLQAPFSGIITEKTLEPGNLAMPGAPLLTIEQQGSFRFQTLVEEAQIAKVRQGQTVTVSLDSFDRSFAGKVSEITPAVDPAAHSFMVKIDLPAASGLRSGLFGRARFPVGSRRLLAVPEKAILERGQMQWVFVADSGVARSRMVTTGRRYERLVEALSGLAAGERVISPAPANLSDGALVEILP